MGLVTGNVFGLSLGDTINSNTAKAETNTTSTMILTAQKSDHSEYTISKATGSTVALVNKSGKVYGFKWSDKAPDINSMLGSYKSEFDTAYANRPRGDHRRLIINTTHLSVNQAGLPGSKFSGSMYAKDLAPTN